MNNKKFAEKSEISISREKKYSKRYILIIIFLITIFSSSVLLQAEPFRLRITATSAAYYANYPSYNIDNPVIGGNISVELFNIYRQLGIGGTAFFKITSYNNYFNDLRYYEAYLHNFYNYKQDKAYFVYGFFGGIKKTEIDYEEYKSGDNYQLSMIRPLAGFHFSNENWGTTLKWTQNEDKKSKFEYELKFRNSIGLIFLIGGSFKGPITGIKSDFHIYAGYELFI